eukprot:2552930-Pyramimonas_sp.AAC.1
MSVIPEIPGTNKNLQQKIYSALHKRSPAGVLPMDGVYTRLTKWVPDISRCMLDSCIKQIRSVCRMTSTHIGFSVLRSCCRGVCTSARFRDMSRPSCCFGCPIEYSSAGAPVNLDNLKHY